MSATPYEWKSLWRIACIVDNEGHDFIGTQTFLCEGCHKRFMVTKLWKPNYRWHVGDALFPYRDMLANYVCSRRCSGIATRRKEQLHQTLDDYLVLFGIHGVSTKKPR